MRAYLWVLLSAVLLDGCAKMAPAKEEPAACAAEPWRVRDVGGGVLRQCNGLEWAQSDNGRDINWYDAQATCASRGPGWDLPTVAELRSLGSASAPGIRCGKFHCAVDSPFRLSSLYFWSNERFGLLRATFDLHFGATITSGGFIGLATRALCVRRS